MPTVKENLTNVNYKERGTAPSWIVIHNTANGSSVEGMAYNNTQYFKNVVRDASATYFIDDGDTVWQCVSERDTAWHCGESPSQNGCYNYNSIGIEVCERADGTFSDKEIATLRWLVTDIMQRYGIDADHVCRHHDVTGKECPWYYTDDDRWQELKAKIVSQAVKPGWVQDERGWWYRDEDGGYPAGCWRKINGEWYLFDDDGYMLTGWQYTGGKWYLLGSDGAMITGWYKGPINWYYMDASGAMACNELKQIGNYCYGFDKDGHMITDVKSLTVKADGSIAIK